MKVLHISSMAERGGLEVVLLNILKCLDRSRLTPQVLFLEDGPFVTDVRETGTETYLIRAGRVRQVVKLGKVVRTTLRSYVAAFGNVTPEPATSMSRRLVRSTNSVVRPVVMWIVV